MADVFTNKIDNPLSYHIVESELDAFLKKLDFNEYRVYDSLYYFEESVFSRIVFDLNNCKLPHHFTSYKDVLREKIFLHFGFGNTDLDDANPYSWIAKVKRYF